MDSRDAVISDDQLEALLDRTLTSKDRKINKKESSAKSSHQAAGDQSLFRVIEERDAKGNVLREGDDSAPTTDTWHIVGESDGNSTSEEKIKEGPTTTVTSNASTRSSDLNNGVAEMEAVAGEGSDRGQTKSSDVSCDQGESTVGDGADQVKSSAAKTEQSSVDRGQDKASSSQSESLTLNGPKQAETVFVDADLGENTKADSKLPTVMEGRTNNNFEPQPNSVLLENADKGLVTADVADNLKLCGSSNVALIESDCVNEASCLDTKSSTTNSSENNNIAPKAAVYKEQLASDHETMATCTDSQGSTVLGSNGYKLEIGSNQNLDTKPLTTTMNEA